MGSTGFTTLPAYPGPVGPIDPGPVLKMTRWGFAAKQTQTYLDDAKTIPDGNGPTWAETKGPLSTNSGLAGKIKLRRVYLGRDPKTGVVDRILNGKDDINELAAMGGVVMLSGQWDTADEIAQVKADLATFDPTKLFMAITQHEPVGNIMSDGSTMTPLRYRTIQNLWLDATAPYQFAIPCPLWNGYWFSGGKQNRKVLNSQGGFPAWMDATTAGRFISQGGVLLFDAYDGGAPARPGNNPPTVEKFGESPGVRIRNAKQWASGLPFEDDGTGVPGSLTVWPRVGCGEIGTAVLEHMYDTFQAAEECLDYASWWNRRGDLSALEKVSPALPNGNGGNSNSRAYYDRYLQAHDRVQALGGPPALTA